MALFSSKSFLLKKESNTFGKKDTIISLVVMIVTIIIALAPMAISPMWNGEIYIEQHHQYEKLADSIIDGHVDLDYGPTDPKLLAMDNPYDPQARVDEGVVYHWDHAYYNGKFYMYFGVVPVILLFVPVKLVTGSTLTTMAATRFVLALFIVGLFWLFRLLNRRFFKTMPLALTLLMSVALSFVSSWYIMDTPVLYCTAIASGMCCQVWSFYFFIRGVFVQKKNKKVIRDAVLGAIFGALVWGCRPTIGFASLAVLPIAVVYIRKYMIMGYECDGRVGELFLLYRLNLKNVVDFNKRENDKIKRKLIVSVIRNICVVAIPYIIIGVILMIYNYVRFDSFFEFGQSYQLTVADQTAYGSFFEKFSLVDAINGIATTFFNVNTNFVKNQFPFFNYSGVFIEFPILFIGFAIFFKRVELKLKDDGIFGLTVALIIIPYLITIMATVMTPYLLERYKSDFLFIMAIATFILAGELNKTTRKEYKNKFRSLVSYLSIMAILGAFVLFVTPNDGNYVAYFPAKLETICKCIFFGNSF